jgi:hypothetical protein
VRSRAFVVLWREHLRESDVDRTAKLVGHTLSTYMNPEGWARVGKETLARTCSMTDRGVDGGVNRLEAAGLISVKRSRGGNALSEVNEYQAIGITGEPRSRVPGNGKRSAGNGVPLSRERRSPEVVEVDERARTRAAISHEITRCVCEECGVGGGAHFAGCSIAEAAA